MQQQVVTEITKTYKKDRVQMKVITRNGDINKIMFHRLDDNSVWIHMFSIKEHQMFSLHKTKMVMYEIQCLCNIVIELLENLGG